MINQDLYSFQEALDKILEYDKEPSIELADDLIDQYFALVVGMRDFREAYLSKDGSNTFVNYSKIDQTLKIIVDEGLSKMFDVCTERFRFRLKIKGKL